MAKIDEWPWRTTCIEDKRACTKVAGGPGIALDGFGKCAGFCELSLCSDAEYAKWIQARLGTNRPPLLVATKAFTCESIRGVVVLFVLEREVVEQLNIGDKLGKVDLWLNNRLYKEKTSHLMPPWYDFSVGYINLFGAEKFSEPDLRALEYEMPIIIHRMVLERLTDPEGPSGLHRSLIDNWETQIKAGAVISEDFEAAFPNVMQYRWTDGFGSKEEMIQRVPVRGQSLNSADSSAMRIRLSKSVDPTQSPYREIFAAHGSPVLDARDPETLVLLNRYSAKGGVELLQVDTKEAILTELGAKTVDGEEWSELSDEIAEAAHVESTSVHAFSIDVPAFYIARMNFDDEVIQETKASDHIWDPQLRSYRRAVDRHKSWRPGSDDYLIVNADHSFVLNLKSYRSGGTARMLGIRFLELMAHKLSVGSIDHVQQATEWLTVGQLLTRVDLLEEEKDRLEARIEELTNNDHTYEAMAGELARATAKLKAVNQQLKVERAKLSDVEMSARYTVTLRNYQDAVTYLTRPMSTI